MPKIDFDQAQSLLHESFDAAERFLLQQQTPEIPNNLIDHFNTIFSSRTQAYREVLLGCSIVRLLNEQMNIRLPYTSQGKNAFSGRQLDERVINPFLQSKRIPSTRGPYLSTFRRQANFLPETRERVRDRSGFDALLELLTYLENTSDEDKLLEFLVYILFKFAELREAADIELSRLQRISLDQYRQLLNHLIGTPSGGLYPVILSVSMFETIRDYFNLEWNIQWQGINVADLASGVGGDITISSNNNVILAIEVTERPVDKARVVATFNTKISPASIKDYLFLVGQQEPTTEAIQQADMYFAQGHEINFLEVCNWILMLLGTIGIAGRNSFNSQLMDLLESEEVPPGLKVAWNEAVASLFSN